ncbi:hypothetical protein V2E67_001723 [Citrobacter freundii]|nr:hypothetical protein [Citrobacter freundii]
MENEVDKLLKELSDIDGVRKVAVINNVEKKIARGINMDESSTVLVRTLSDVVRSNMKYSRLTARKNEIEDVLITYFDEIHLLKPLSRTAKYFIYISISRGANIALTRIKLNEKLTMYLK